MNTERQAFETWITTPPFNFPIKRDNLGTYSHYSVQLAWNSWQAAASSNRKELRKLQHVLQAAVKLVNASTWAGVSDEDCELERILQKYQYLGKV